MRLKALLLSSTAMVPVLAPSELAEPIVGLAKFGRQWAFGRQWLQAELEQGLREGELGLCIHATKQADAGLDIADAALRNVVTEMMAVPGNRLPGQGAGWVQIWAYGQRAQKEPFKRPRGRPRYDNLVRDLHICFFVILACHDYGVRPTRNLSPGRSSCPGPSGISIVQEMLIRERSLHLDEAHIQRNIWEGLAGELARRHAPASLWPAASPCG